MSTNLEHINMDAHVGVKDHGNNLSLPMNRVSQTLTDSGGTEVEVRDHMKSWDGDAYGAQESAEQPLSWLDHGYFENMERYAAKGTCELDSNGRMKVMGGEILGELEAGSNVGIIEKVGNFSSGCIKVDDGKDDVQGLEGAVDLDKGNQDHGDLVLESSVSVQNVGGLCEMQRTDSGQESENKRERNEERVVRLNVELNIEKNSTRANVGGDMFHQGIGVTMDTGIPKTHIARSVDVLNSVYFNLEAHSNGFKRRSCQLYSSFPDFVARVSDSNVSTCQKDFHAVKDRKTSPLISNRVIRDHISGSGGDESRVNLVVDLSPHVNIDLFHLERTRGASSPDFGAGDLVWSKVRSHPWWPGQIFEPSAASESAKKYFKEDRYLVAYFGDQTFAWVAASKIKPFEKHFSQMKGQSDSADFEHAVDCALDEISRRIECGLSCPCMTEQVYTKLKTQFIINAGIREQCSRRDGGDRNLNATSFVPFQLINYLKYAAQSPLSVPDKLEFVSARAQVWSFHRSKVYIHLPESKMLESQFHNDMKNPFMEEQTNEISIQMVSHRDLKNKDRASHKRKQASYDGFQPFKKERSLSDLMYGKQLLCPHDERISDGNTCNELISHSPVRKRKAVMTRCDDQLLKDGRSKFLTATSKVPRIKHSFTVDDGIHRSTGQMTEWSPSLECGTRIPQETPCDSMHKLKSFHEYWKQLLEPSDHACTEDMLSQLCLAARDPVCHQHSFLNDMFLFFLKFSNFSREENNFGMQENLSLEKPSDDDNVQKATNEVVSATSDVKYSTDSYWTDRLIESIPENKKCLDIPNGSTQSLSAWYTERDLPSSEPQLPAVVVGPGLNHVDENSSASHSDGSSQQGFCPVSLSLKFTNLASVPTEPNLNKIFSRFGPLIESETKILVRSCRARVVFRRRDDAETAFSSAGKYSTFGPALISYRLKYVAPKLQKSTGRKRGRKPKFVDGSATQNLSIQSVAASW